MVRRTADPQPEKVEDLNVHQNAMERLFLFVSQVTRTFEATHGATRFAWLLNSADLVISHSRQRKGLYGI